MLVVEIQDHFLTSAGTLSFAFNKVDELKVSHFRSPIC